MWQPRVRGTWTFKAVPQVSTPPLRWSTTAQKSSMRLPNGIVWPTLRLAWLVTDVPNTWTPRRCLRPRGLPGAFLRRSPVLGGGFGALKTGSNPRSKSVRDRVGIGSGGTWNGSEFAVSCVPQGSGGQRGADLDLAPLWLFRKPPLRSSYPHNSLWHHPPALHAPPRHLHAPSHGLLPAHSPPRPPNAPPLYICTTPPLPPLPSLPCPVPSLPSLHSLPDKCSGLHGSCRDAPP